MNRLLLALFVVLIPSYVLAISFTDGVYENSFSCSSIATCFDFANQEGSSSLCGESTSFAAGNNNPLGTNNGMRVVFGDGLHNYTYTGGYELASGVTEFWLRFYIKFATDFDAEPYYTKLVYVYTQPFSSDGNCSPVFEFHGATPDTLRLAQVGASGTTNIDDSSAGWVSMNGGVAGDGQWHSMEMHLKTGAGNGIYQAWVDGVLVADHSNVNYGGGETFYWFTFISNSDDISTTDGCADVFVDDIAIYTTTPLNLDAANNPMIGPIDWSSEQPPYIIGIPIIQGVTIR